MESIEKPIRILQVVTNMSYGGLENLLMNYYRHIDRSMVQFDFLTHFSGNQDFEEEINQLGGKLYRISSLNPFSIKYKQELKQFLRDHPEYLVVHSHLNCMSSVILKAAKKCGIDYRIAHSHTSAQVKNFRYPIKMFYKRFIPRYATKLFACSIEAGEFLFDKNEYEILNNAIDTKEYVFDPAKYRLMRESLHIDEDELLVGHIGKFRYQKNQSFLVDVFAEIVKQRKAKLLLVGEGELRSTVKNKVDELGLSEKVIFTGARPDVADLLQAMDVFVFPSMYEGFGIVVVEAQAAGLPCLISDKVAIDSKKTDLVFTESLESKPAQWAERVIQLSESERQNTYSEILKSGYDISENAKQLQNFYTKTYSGEQNVCLY